MAQSISVSTPNEDSPAWFVYILQNRLGHLYTGVTTDPARRIRQHRGELAGGARALKGKAPLVFQAIWQCPGRTDAQQLEYALKQLSRATKWQVIHQQCALPGGIEATLVTGTFLR